MLVGIVIVLLRCVLFGYAARQVSEYRNEPDGFWWGFVLGSIGLLIVVFRKPTVTEVPVSPAPPNYAFRQQPLLKKNCPVCGAINNAGNTACFACGKAFQN